VYCRNNITKLTSWVLGHRTQLLHAALNKPQDPVEAADREVVNICMLLEWHRKWHGKISADWASLGTAKALCLFEIA